MYVSTLQFVLLQPLFMFNLESDENREEKMLPYLMQRCAFCFVSFVPHNTLSIIVDYGSFS